MRSPINTRRIAALACAGGMILGLVSVATTIRAVASPAGPSAVAVPFDAAGVASRLAAAGATFAGRQAPAKLVKVAFTLPLSNQDKLNTLLQNLYNPSSPQFHQWLTPEQFADQFGANQADFDAVVAYAKSKGLQVVDTAKNRALIVVSGPSSVMESALGVSFNTYQTKDGDTVYASTAPASVPTNIAGRISGLLGLTNYGVPKPMTSHAQIVDRILERSLFGVSPQDEIPGMTPQQFKQAYSLSDTYLGDGQTVALFEIGGYTPSDVSFYTQQTNLPNATLTNELVGGYDGSVIGTQDEVTGDIELVLAVAPDVQIYVYEGDPNDASVFVDVLARIAGDNLAHVVSMSYGEGEDVIQQTDPGQFDAENTVFTEMATQGQSVFVSSGDSGAYGDAPFIDPPTIVTDDPASQPLVTGVGGTTLFTNGGSYSNETVWLGTLAGAPFNDGGSGGGFSSVWAKPTYQAAINEGESMRNVPDVAQDADPASGMEVYEDGGWIPFGGTSQSAPLWAGFFALANERRVSVTPKLTVLGQANLVIYPIAQGAYYNTAFNDITVGNNLVYSAGTGYDNCTGWGTYQGDNLLDIITSGAALTALSPSSVTQHHPSFPLTVTGVGFAQGDTVIFGTDTLTPSNITATSMTVTVPANDVSTAGLINVSVSAAGGLTTNTLVFIVNPAPVVSSLSPSAVTSGHPDLPLVITGTNFVSTDLVNFNGNILTPSQISQTKIVVTVPAADLVSSTLEQVPVSVVSVDGVASNSLPFSIGPAPTLTSINPTTVQSGHPQFTLTLTGANFVSGDIVIFGTDNITPTSVTATTIQATIPTTDLVVGSIPVLVQTQDDVNTQTLTFTVTPAPTLTSISPTSASVGDPAFTMTVVGTGFSSGDTVSWNGTSLSTVFVSATSLQASVPASDLSVAGQIGVTVETPQEGNSNALTFTVNNPVPTLTSISPTTEPAGAAQFTLTATGANFVPGATISWAGTSLVTTYISHTQLTAIVPASDVASGGQFAVLVANPTPGGGTSATIKFIVTGVTTVYGSVTRIFDGQTVGNVTVTITDSQNNTYVTTTTQATSLGPDNAAMNYEFTEMPGGTYTVSLTANGYVIPSTDAASITVPNTGSVRQNFPLSSIHTYPAGLQMMSAPNDYSGINIFDALPDVGTSPIVAWDPVAFAYVFAPNSPADALHPGRGYWGEFATSVDLVGTATPIVTKSFAVQLGAGWNIIADPFTTPILVSDMQSGSTASPVPASQLISQTLYSYDQTSGGYDAVTGSTALEPYSGYWVYAIKAGTLILNQPSVQ